MHKLPNGETTRSIAKYLDEWGKVIVSIKKQLGVDVTAYDPGFAVRNSGGSGSAEIPMWLALRILDNSKQLSSLTRGLKKIVRESNGPCGGGGTLDEYSQGSKAATDRICGKIKELLKQIEE